MDSSVFSSGGRRVATFVEAEGEQELASIDVASGRWVELAEGGTEIGRVIGWQPTRRF